MLYFKKASSRKLMNDISDRAAAQKEVGTGYIAISITEVEEIINIVSDCIKVMDIIEAAMKDVNKI